MARRRDLRASDAERELVAERLRQAAGEGRLLSHELEQRLGRALRALTLGELDALIADLPGKRLAARRPAHVSPANTVAIGVAVALAAMVIVALAAVVLAGLAGMWMIWMVFAWRFFGRHPAHRRRHHHSRRAQLYVAGRRGML